MRRRALIFAVLYTVVILYLCLYPGTFLSAPTATSLQWVPITGRRQMLDGVLNFLLYLPLGFAAALAVGRRRWGLCVVLVLGSGLSLLVEYLQMWTPNRYSNYNDWLLNSAGTIVGLALTRVSLDSRDSSWARWSQTWRLAPRATLMCSLWLLWFAFPFVPRISPSLALFQIANPRPWSWADLISTALGMASLRTILGPSPWVAVAFSVVVGQPFMLDKTLSYAWVSGAALGWAAAARRPSNGRLLGWLLPMWLIYEQFRPWALSATLPTDFSWIPFASWYDGDPSAYYAMIFGKLYLYTITPWMMRFAGMSWTWAVCTPLAIVMSGEWAQRYLSGRTPESTDVVLLLAGLTLTLLIRERAPAMAPY